MLEFAKIDSHHRLLGLLLFPREVAATIVSFQPLLMSLVAQRLCP